MKTPRTDNLIKKYCGAGYSDYTFKVKAIKLLKELETERNLFADERQRLLKLMGQNL